MVGGHMTIFSDVKDALGINPEDEAFDTRIKMHLETELAVLGQLGVFDGGDNFDLGTLTWSDLDARSRDPNNQHFSMVKNYILLRTQLVFDPPNGSVLTYQENIVKELTWRIREAYFVKE